MFTLKIQGRGRLNKATFYKLSHGQKLLHGAKSLTNLLFSDQEHQHFTSLSDTKDTLLIRAEVLFKRLKGLVLIMIMYAHRAIAELFCWKFYFCLAGFRAPARVGAFSYRATALRGSFRRHSCRDHIFHFFASKAIRARTRSKQKSDSPSY